MLKIGFVPQECGCTILRRYRGRESPRRLALSSEQRQRLLEIANACPTHKLLTNPIRIFTGLAS